MNGIYLEPVLHGRYPEHAPAALLPPAALIADGQLEVPIAATYPLGQVQEAYQQLASGHIRGKIVLTF